jgi:hypothetical protein
VSERFLLRESARRFGHCAWFEQRLFEVLGAWAGDTKDAVARPVMAAHAAHHAWHADVLRQRLPRARGFDIDALVAPPNREAVELFDAMAALGPGDTTARLGAVYRVVVPHLGQAYLYHLDRLVPISDGPTMRWLRIVLRDEVVDWRAGVLLVEPHAADPAEWRRFADLLAAAGGAAGPETLGAEPIRGLDDYEDDLEPVPPVPPVPRSQWR